MQAVSNVYKFQFQCGGHHFNFQLPARLESILSGSSIDTVFEDDPNDVLYLVFHQQSEIKSEEVVNNPSVVVNITKGLLYL